jgi:hypothetical protein
MSAEAFDDSKYDVDSLAISDAWLAETLEGSLAACREYALHPSRVAHDALYTHLDNSTLAIRSTVLALTETGLDDDCLASVATVLVREDHERATQMKRCAPELNIAEFQGDKPVVDAVILQIRVFASYDANEFSRLIGVFFKSSAQKDLEKFITLVNQTHAWGATGVEPPVETSEPTLSTPNTNTVPDLLGKEALGAARTALGRLGKVGKLALRLLPQS